MALRWLVATTLALVLVVIAIATTSAAQQTTFPTLPSCPPAPLSLSPCLGYVFGAGSATLDSCCHQLRTFVQAQAPCLCAASKLAPSPVGMLLGQAQGVIPNVCNLPNPCDDGDAAHETTTAPAAARPSGTDDNSSPRATTAPAAPPAGEQQAPSATTATTPSSTPSASAAPATETASTPPEDDDDDPEDDDDSPPAVATAPGQFAQAGTGSTKLPQLLHAADATRSRDVTAVVGTLIIALLLASVATI